MRNKLPSLIVAALWLVFTPFLCIYCWESGRNYSLFYPKNPARGVVTVPAPVSLSDELTNTPLNSYSWGLAMIPKTKGLPAGGYVELVAIPNRSALTKGSPPGGMLEIRGVFQNGYEVVKPFSISSQMLAASGPFIIFLDYTTPNTDLYEFRMPQICREK
jgi:hypothetical protein